jgi:hypothetical protein
MLFRAKHRCVVLLLGVVAGPLCADEALVYNLKWPTGVAHGRSELRITQGSTNIEFKLDASLPGIPASGTFISKMDGKGCSKDFVKRYEFGFRRSSEHITIEDGQGRRETANGGTSTFDAGECEHDALAFLQFLRAELIAGRKPAGATILFGARYSLTLDYPQPTGDAETVKVTVKGPGSTHSFEIDFLRDALRTPARVRVPLMMGKFLLEIAR